MKNKFSISEKNPLRKKYLAGIHAPPLEKFQEQSLKVILMEVISKKPEQVIKVLRDKIKEDPFFGIYGIKKISPFELRTVIAVLMDRTQQTHDYLTSDKVGPASHLREISGTEALPTQAIGKDLLELYSGWFSGGKKGERDLLKKALTMPVKEERSRGMKLTEMAKVIDQIKKEDIKLVEYINVIVTSLDIVDTEEEDTWFFKYNMGYLYGLVSEQEITEAIQNREFTTNTLDIFEKPLTSTEGTAVFKKLKDAPEIVNHSKLLEYLDIAKEKANEFIQGAETERTISEKSVYRPPEEEQKLVKLRGYEFPEDRKKKKKKATEESEGAEEVPVEDSGYGSEVPFQSTELEEEEVVPEETPAKVEEESRNYLKNYRILFGRHGNIQLELEIIIDNKEIKEVVEIWGDTLSDLLTEEGSNFILNSIDDTVKNYVGKAPFAHMPVPGSPHRKIREDFSVQTERTPFQNVNNGRYYYYIYNIDTNALINSNTTHPEEFIQYYENLKKHREAEL